MTIKEIAQIAGVSISTVSKVMNHKDSSISTETRERVLRVIKDFNYTPYSNGLTSSKNSFLLGVLCNALENNLILKGIIDAAQTLGYTVLVAESNGDAEAEYKWINNFCRHQVAAVLWQPVKTSSFPCADTLQDSGIPFLHFHTSKEENACNIDFEQMGFAATEAMIKAQHKDIACLLANGIRTEHFLNGYRKCLFENGIPFREHLVFREINDSLRNQITRHTVTGIVSSHFGSALKLYEDLTSLHYHIPADVSVVSLRSDISKSRTFPQISAFTIPYFSYGQHLAQSLIEQLEQGYKIPPFHAEITLDHNATIRIPFNHPSHRMVVVGSINMDHYLKVEELPTSGKTIISTDSSLYSGGKGINQAIGASKLGAHVTLIGAVGDDMDSNTILAALKEYSIESSGVRRIPNCSTGKAHIFVQPNGDSLISILPGANSTLKPEDIRYNEDAFKYSSYCLMQTEVSQTTLVQAGKLAKEYGHKIILKPSACSHVEPELLQYVDIFVPNQNEINVLCSGKKLSEQAEYFLNKGVETVIITLGENGCYLKTRKHEEYFSAADFTPVDSTGAGDAFISALAVYLMKGYSLPASIKIATYAAGFSITREGVPPALIDQNTLETYIKQKEPELLEL